MLTRQAWHWLLIASRFARVGRRRTWHSLSCFAIKYSPARVNARASRTYASHLAASASHQGGHEHRNGCDFEKRSARAIIEHCYHPPPILLYNPTLLFCGFASLFLFLYPLHACTPEVHILGFVKSKHCTLSFVLANILSYSNLGYAMALVTYMRIVTVLKEIEVGYKLKKNDRTTEKHNNVTLSCLDVTFAEIRPITQTDHFCLPRQTAW